MRTSSGTVFVGDKRSLSIDYNIVKLKVKLTELTSHPGVERTR